MDFFKKLRRHKMSTASINKLVEDSLVLPTSTVAGLTAYPAASHTGKMIRVSNGAAGSPCLAVSDGTTWNRVLVGAAVAAA